MNNDSLPVFRFVIPAYPYFNVYSYIKMPPLGIMSVAKSVDRMDEFNVEVIDENNY